MFKISTREDGATAIEFAFIAPVFFLLIFGVLEFALICYVQGVLNTVVSNAGQMGMTGNSYAYLQDPNQPPMSREQFITSYINQRIGPLSSLGTLTINTTSFGALTGLTQGGGGTAGGYGGGGQIVLYSVDFAWNILTPMMDPLIGDGSGNFIINARTVIQNEVF